MKQLKMLFALVALALTFAVPSKTAEAAAETECVVEHCHHLFGDICRMGWDCEGEPVWENVQCSFFPQYCEVP